MRLRPLLLALIACLLGLGAAAPTQASPQAPPPTVVSFTFDDGFASQLRVTDVLARHDMKATYFANSGALGWDGYMTRRQLLELQRNGHEIGGHTISHDHLTRLPRARMQREICDDRAALLDMGLEVTSFAYPYSDYNRAVVRTVEQCGYHTARTSSGLYNGPGDCEDCPVANELPVTDDRWTIRTNETVRRGPDTVRTLKAYVARAERTGGWVPLVFHRICDNCSEESITRAQFAAFVRWLADRPSTTVVQKVNQVMTGQCHPFMEDALYRVDEEGACTAALAGGEDAAPAGRSLNNAVAFSVGPFGVGQVEVIMLTLTIAFGSIGWYRFRTRRQRADRART